MMTTIDMLNSTSQLSDADQVPVFSSQNGDSRKMSLYLLAQYLQAKISAGDDKITQYAAPSNTGFSVSVNPMVFGQSVWLILTPTGSFAAGAIVLPNKDTTIDRQEVLINTTQAITSLTVNPNGASIMGAPSTLAAGAYFRLRFDGVMKTWYRVG